jgi:hypothetical protein
MALLKEKDLLAKINKLPSEKRQEVCDFIAFLEGKIGKEDAQKMGKKKIELKAFHLGKIKGSLSRKEIYESR